MSIGLPAINSPLLFGYCEVERKTELAAMKQQPKIVINFPTEDGFTGESVRETQSCAIMV